MALKKPSAVYSAQAAYKQTEVGWIPSDWVVKAIGEIASVSAGGTPSRKLIEYWNGNIPWVTTTELNSERVFETEQYISRLGLENSSAKLVAPGAVLIALYGQGKTRGKVSILEIRAATNQACAAIVVAPTTANRFVFHGLHSQYRSIRSLSNAGSQENLSSGIVKGIQLPLPPTFVEQEAIADTLTDADALIESLEQLLTKKRQIKQGAMQELLTGQRRLPGFSGKWATTSLADLGTFLKGSGISRGQAQSGPIACVRYGEIYTTHNDHIRSFESGISRAVAATATLLRKGDILFAGSGETKAEIGKCVAFLDDVEAYAGGDIVILRPSGFDSRFLGYALNTAEVNRQKASRGQGDAVVHISAAALAQITLPTPTRDEQTAIATILSDMDAEITALEARLTQARHLKQGMAQALLTGRIRLVPPGGG